MEDHGDGYHPVRLIVGFHGGNPKSASWGSQPFAWTGSALPPHNRALAITLGASALERGTLSGPIGERRSAPRYTARGGRENTGSWWLETINLSRLYARAWPGDDAGGATVVFIRLAAAGGRAPAVANFSRMVLPR